MKDVLKIVNKRTNIPVEKLTLIDKTIIEKQDGAGPSYNSITSAVVEGPDDIYYVWEQYFDIATNGYHVMVKSKKGLYYLSGTPFYQEYERKLWKLKPMCELGRCPNCKNYMTPLYYSTADDLTKSIDTGLVDMETIMIDYPETIKIQSICLKCDC